MSFFAVGPSVSGSSAATPRRTARNARAPLALVALLATASAIPSGCAQLPDDGSTGTAVEELNANSRIAFDYFLGKGLTAVQAAGIVGNLMQESNVSPTAVQPGGPGRGIAQWSVGGRWDTDRGDNATAFAASSGASVWSLTLQLDFIWDELTHFSGYGLAALRASTSVTAATVAFQTDFEGCGTCLESQRIAYANQALAAYGGDAVSSWGGQFVSQTFPYASVGAVNIPAGGTARISITMQNIGTHAWDSHTCIATTGPRDRTSVFAGPEWTGANRPSCVPAGTTVAHGANHTFTWTMHAPAATGHYDEHWGMVEDGVTWFSAAGEAGPPDTDLEGMFDVTAPVVGPDAGTPDAGVAHDAGHDAAAVEDASSTEDVVIGEDASTNAGDAAHSDAGDSGHADVVHDHVGDGGTSEMPVGCACRAAGGGQRPSRSGAATLLMAAFAVAGARRRRAR